MVEIIENFIDLSTSFINKIFLLEIEFQKGQIIPIGKVVTAFIFIAFSLYFILDTLGIIGGGEE